MAGVKDHVSLIQEAFEDLLDTMFNAISSINRDAVRSEHTNDPNQLRFDQLPALADQVIERVKNVDAVINEADAKSCIGKDVEEVRAELAEKTQEIDAKRQALRPQCEEAEVHIERIEYILDRIVKSSLNTCH